MVPFDVIISKCTTYECEMPYLKLPASPAKFKKANLQGTDEQSAGETLKFEPGQSFFFTDIIEAFVPNSMSTPAPNQQFICRVKIVDSHFELATKALPAYNSTLQHEYETILATSATKLNEQIQPNCTHPQPFYANNNFVNKFGIYAESKQFPIGNSSYCNFGGERLFFLDTKDNLAQYFIYYEIEQVPTWSNPRCAPLVYSVMRMDNFLLFQNQECDLKLFKYGGEQSVIAQMAYMGPIQKIEYQGETQFANLFAVKKNQNFAGQLRVRIGFETPEEVAKRRATRKREDLALFPHEKQEQPCDYQEDAKQELYNEYQNIDFDPEAQQIMNDLHKDSLALIKRSGSFEQSVYNKPLVYDITGFGSFASCSVSAVAIQQVGNAALGAAAVVAYNNVYNIILFNVKSGYIISVLGTHFGYVYALSFSPCGFYLASASADGNINIFKVQYFTFYGFHFWYDYKLDELANLKAELSQAFNQKEKAQLPIYQKYLRFEGICDYNVDFKKGSVQNDISCLRIITKQISACGPNLNEIVNSLEQIKVYEITQMVYLTTISVGLCVYEAQFLEIYESSNFKPITPQLVMDQAKYDENYAEVLQNYKILYGGYSGQLLCQYMINDYAISMTLATFNSYINCFAVESVRVKSGAADKRVFYIFTCEENGTARILRLDYQQNGYKKQEAFYCPEGVKSAVFLDDCKKVLLYMYNGRLLLMENGSKSKGAIIKDFYAPVHSQQLPGGCKIGKVGNTAYAGCYGGKILAISNKCNIVKSYQPFGGVVSGLVPSCVAGSKFGILLIGFSILASNIAPQYTPQSETYYISVPVVVLGTQTGYYFDGGSIKARQPLEDDTKEAAYQAATDYVEEQAKMQQDLIQDYLDFIRNACKDLK